VFGDILPKVFRIFGKKKPTIKDLAKTTLVEFDTTMGCDSTINDLIKYYAKRDKDILLVISASKKNLYLTELSAYIQRGILRIVAIPLEGGNMHLKGEILEIPVSELGWFSEIWKNYPNVDIVIFEPLSDLILLNDVKPTYMFLKGMIEFLLPKDCGIIAFVNKEAHTLQVLSIFEDFFQKIIEIEPSGLIKIKK